MTPTETLTVELARVTAERDAARDYAAQARIRENAAEQERVSTSFRLANAEVKLRQAQARIAELEARLDQGLWSRL